MSVAKATRVGVVHHNRVKADGGYTLFAPQGTRDVYLIDIDGFVINHWRMPYIPGCHARLLPNGNLFWAGQVKGALEYGYPEEFSGLGGLVREVDWEGNVISSRIKRPEYADVFLIGETSRGEFKLQVDQENNKKVFVKFEPNFIMQCSKDQTHIFPNRSFKYCPLCGNKLKKIKKPDR